MKRSTVALIAVLALTGLATAQTRREPLVENGQLIYQTSCAICHGTDGRGEGGVSSSLTVPAPDLTTLSRAHGGLFPAAEVTRVIRGGSEVTEHGGQMPAWGMMFLKDLDALTGSAPLSDAALTEMRIADLVAYLRQLQR
jgi:mono/diheme cytochrome c family protein